MKIEINGTRLHVADTGTGETALVFLHHWGGSSRTWSAVVDELGDRFRCIAIDARGAGESDAPATGYATADHVADVLGVVEALGLVRYVVVGHSMGGKAAQLLASRRPRGLAGVVLVASSPASAMAIGEPQRAQMKAAYADRDAIAWTLDNVLLGSPVAAEVREQLVVDASRLAPPARAGWIDTGTRDNFEQAVANVEVPVAIIAGMEDRVDPPEVVKTRIAPRYPSAPVRMLPGKGHLLPVEAPREIADFVRDFASSLSL